MISHHIDEMHIVPGALEPRADAAANGAGAPDQDRVHYQASSMARVSATATSQIACISASLRWVRPP